MRKIIFQMMTSLDGYFEGPNHDLSWHVVDGEFNQYAGDFLRTIDALIFGRVTYQLMASYWPTATDDDAVVTERMNNLPKIVISRTLDKVGWNNSRLIKDNVAEEISALKQQPGRDMTIFGSSNLCLTLIKHGLIDEYRIAVNPVVIGSGTPLFHGLTERFKLKLTKSITLKSGLEFLYYRSV
jgi:dihydrofolate reductase